MDRLLKKFAEGISRSLRVYGGTPPGHDFDAPDADWVAILNVWEAVGKDIHTATVKFSEEFEQDAHQLELPGWQRDRELA